LTSAFHRPIRRLNGELGWLAAEFLSAVTAGTQRQQQLACEMAVIRLHDSWARFCRELIVLSAFGRTVTLAGVPLAPCHGSVKRCHLVMPYLFRTPGPRYRFEPRWADATSCIQAATRLGIINLPTVSAALAATNSPAEHIRRVRNFYAHRSRRGIQDAMATGVFSSPVRADVFELAAYTTGSVRVIESWVSNLVLVATAAAQ
jgi:hypothetical protein